MASDGMIVRIPGPQILAYVQQIVPQDTSGQYDPEKSLGKSFYLPQPASPELSKNPSGDGARPQHGMRAPDSETEKGQKTEDLLPMFDVRRTHMTPAPLTWYTKRPSPETEGDICQSTSPQGSRTSKRTECLPEALGLSVARNAGGAREERVLAD